MALDRDTKNMVIGAAVGGVVGIGTSLLCTGHFGRRSPLDNISKVIGQMSEAVGSIQKEGRPVVREAEQFLHNRSNTLSEMVGLIAEGMKLWQKLKG